MDKELLKIIFVSSIVLVLLAAAIVAWVLIYKFLYYPKHFKNDHYKLVRKIVDNYDFRLINKFYFLVEENMKAMVDHVIFADKFIYVVLSRYYDGDISGNINDKSLIFTNKKGKKYYTDNPYRYLDYILSRFSTVCGLDKRMLIGVVLTNNSCKNTVISESNQNFVVIKKNFKKLIKEVESRNVGIINDEQLQKAVLIMAKMNLRKDG